MQRSMIKVWISASIHKRDSLGSFLYGVAFRVACNLRRALVRRQRRERPVQDVPRLFYDYVVARGCELVGGRQFDPAQIAREDHWTWRGPYFGGFSLLARKQ